MNYSASISLLLIQLSCYGYAPKTNVPDGHWHTCHGATPTPLPVQRNSSDLGDSHKWTWSGLGGPDPWTPPAQRRPWLGLRLGLWLELVLVAPFHKHLSE